LHTIGSEVRVRTVLSFFFFFSLSFFPLSFFSPVIYRKYLGDAVLPVPRTARAKRQEFWSATLPPFLPVFFFFFFLLAGGRGHEFLASKPRKEVDKSLVISFSLFFFPLPLPLKFGQPGQASPTSRSSARREKENEHLFSFFFSLFPNFPLSIGTE